MDREDQDPLSRSALHRIYAGPLKGNRVVKMESASAEKHRHVSNLISDNALENGVLPLESGIHLKSQKCFKICFGHVRYPCKKTLTSLLSGQKQSVIILTMITDFA